jgi:nitroreductase
MDLFEVILTWRSVRTFTDEAIAEEALDKVVRSAMAAANSGNQQPWRFIVIDDPALRDRICELEIERGGYYRSPQLIVVCGDIGSMKWKMHWLADCAAAIQNLLLAAHGIGLGAVWQELYPYHKRVAAVREMLGIPDSVYPMAVVSIGYPIDVPEPEDRYDPAKVMRDHWYPAQVEDPPQFLAGC